MAKYTMFRGTNEDDVLRFVGFTGADTPHQLMVAGGAGDDMIVLNGYSGVAHGDAGNDTIAANHGADVIRGNEGNDLLLGQGGFDRLFGGADDDTLFGQAGNDTIIGDEGADEIIGGNGNDILFGDKSGGQHKNGAAGVDVFRFDAADGHDKVRDFGVGVDTVVLHGMVDQNYLLTYNGTNSFITFGTTEIKFLGVQLSADDIVVVNDGMTF